MGTAESHGLATRYLRDGHFELTELDFSAPATGRALLEVEAAGICGTDLHITRVPSTYVWDTETLGHEFCGQVIAGPTEWVGRRAVIDPAIFCGVCAACRRGQPTSCENFRAVGITEPGGFAEFAEVPVANLIPVSPDLDPRAAALTEPLACVLYGLSRLPGLEPAGGALVLGGGPIGALFALVLERAMGRRVTVSEPSPERRAHLAKRLEGDVVEPAELGAPGEIDAPDRNGALSQAELDLMPELVVDTTGFLFNTAVELAMPGGVILCFGLEERQSPSAQVLFVQKELTAVSSFAAYGTFATAVRLLEDGIVGADDLVTAELPLREIARAFEIARAGGGLKVLLRPGDVVA